MKFLFGNTILARFKKGNEENLGQNQPTQAVLAFIDAQQQIPGLLSDLVKVEILYSETNLEDEIESVIVAARDGESLLWHYKIDDSNAMDGTIKFPEPAPIDDDDYEQIVTPRLPNARDESEGE